MAGERSAAISSDVPGMSRRPIRNPEGVTETTFVPAASRTQRLPRGDPRLLDRVRLIDRDLHTQHGRRREAHADFMGNVEPAAAGDRLQLGQVPRAADEELGIVRDLPAAKHSRNGQNQHEEDQLAPHGPNRSRGFLA